MNTKYSRDCQTTDRRRAFFMLNLHQVRRDAINISSCCHDATCRQPLATAKAVDINAYPNSKNGANWKTITVAHAVRSHPAKQHSSFPLHFFGLLVSEGSSFRYGKAASLARGSSAASSSYGAVFPMPQIVLCSHVSDGAHFAMQSEDLLALL